MSSMQDGPSQYGPRHSGPPYSGPQGYGQQPYGPPQYGQQQYGQPPYGYPPYGPPQAAPVRKRKKWPWFLLAAILLVLGMFACTAVVGEEAETAPGNAEGDSEAAEETAEEAPEEAESVGIGDTGEVGDWMVTVHGTETAATFSDEFFEEQAQGEFVIVEMTVENSGSEATYFDETALSLTDAEGNSHSTSTTLIDETFFLEQINPGNQVTGQAAFDVPEGTDAVTLEVTDTWGFGYPVEIRLD